MSGSQSYDPFAYGSVKVGQDGAAKAAPAGSPDDILFSEAALPGAGGRVESSRRPAGDADTSWEPMDQGGAAGVGERLEATDFGADILGETETAPPPRPAASMRAAATVRPPATPPVSGPGARHAAAGTTWAEAVSGSSPRPAPGAVVTPAQGLRPQPGRRTSSLSVILPTAIAAASAAGAAWLFLVGKNPVMAALTAAVGLVGAAIAWISTRP